MHCVAARKEVSSRYEQRRICQSPLCRNSGSLRRERARSKIIENVICLQCTFADAWRREEAVSIRQVWRRCTATWFQRGSLCSSDLFFWWRWLWRLRGSVRRRSSWSWRRPHCRYIRADVRIGLQYGSTGSSYSERNDRKGYQHHHKDTFPRSM